MFKNFFVTAFRNLQRNKVYTLITTAGLSLGLACAMLIVLYVKDESSFDRFHTNAGQIYRIDRQTARDDGSVNDGSYTGIFQGPHFAARIPEIKSFVRFQPTQVDIKKGADIQSQPVCLVDANFLSVFSFPLLSGSPATALTQPGSVVITEDMAKKQFGNTDAMGKTILVRSSDMFIPCIVTGVAKNCPQNSSIQFQVLLPLQVSAQDEANNGNWFNYFLTTFVVLEPGADLKATQLKMDKVFQDDAAESIKSIQSKFGVKNIGTSYVFEPLTAIHLGKQVSSVDEILAAKSDPLFSWILSSIALFILLIACINFVNLTVARSVKRAKEIGIRKVIGGTRRQLMIQFLSESFVVCFIAFGFSVYIVIAALPVFNQLSGKALSFSYLFDAGLVTAYCLLFLGTALLAGFYPAVVLSGYDPVQTLYSRFNVAGKNYLQKALVVFQFALASFLIITTLTVFLQVDFLTNQKLGYDDSNLITVKKPKMTRNEAALFKQALLQNPGIADVAPKNGGMSNNTVKISGDKSINIVIATVDASFLPLLKIPVVQGRNFSPDFPADSSSTILVNETFVKQAGWSQAVGQQVTSFDNNKTFTVAGVVKDYHFKPLTEKIDPQIFTMNSSASYGMVWIKIQPHSETQTLAFIAKTFHQLFPLNAFAYSFKDQENANSYQAESKWKQIVLYSAILTIFISCIGLFGLSVLAAEKRTKEIGIRKVLGASVNNIIAVLSTDFLKLIVISLFVSIPFAGLATGKWLQHYPYRINVSWWVYVSSGILVILVALLTVGFQSVKAAIANPAKSLRTS